MTMNKVKYHQGDIVWLNFSPSIGNEMKGIHPAVIVSSNAYNQVSNYIVVCPITSHENDFRGYVPLEGYSIHGRINTTQVYSYSLKRLTSIKVVDHLKIEDMLMVQQYINFIFTVDD